MWFGTEDGLNRYDGHTFTVFKHDDLDSSSLSHNYVRSILQDRQGALWVGTTRGLNRWDSAQEAFQLFRNDPSDPTSLSHDLINVLYQDGNGVLWVGTDGAGLDRFDSASQTFQRFLHDPSNPSSLSNDRVLSIYQDSEELLWIGTAGGLNRLDPDQRTFFHYRHDDQAPYSLSDNEVTAIAEDEAKTLWIGTREGGLNRFDRTSQRFARYRHDASDRSSLSSDRVRAIYLDASKTLWIGTEVGLNKWRPATETFDRYQHDPADPRSLSDDLIKALYQDRGGVLWVGTTIGLNKWTPRAQPFASFTAGSRRFDLSNDAVTSFYEAPNGVLWIGTFGGGLNRYSPETGTFTHYNQSTARADSLSDDRVMSLLVDSEGVLWVGTFAGGLNQFTGNGFRHYRHDPDDPRSLSRNGVMSLYEDREGVLWVGTFEGGLNRFDRANKSFIRYHHDPANPTSLSHDRCQVIYQDRQGVLWVGTDGGGLNRFDRSTGTFTSYRHNPAVSTSLSSDSVLSILEDHEGALWIGTDAGLNRWAPSNRRSNHVRFEKYREPQHLPNDVVYGILPDDEGNLWLSTNNGLSKFNPSDNTFRNYGTAHGLQSAEFNLGAYHRGASGAMYFGGVRGFNMFVPDRIRDNPHVPPVVLSAFWKLNQKVRLEKPIWDTEQIELDYRDYVVSFEFAALDYTAPDQNRYAYKLEGFDEDWIEVGTQRRATYTNLDPGTYVLRVKGSNNDGVWNENGASLRIRMIPPPWKTWWASSLYALLLGSLVFAYVRAQAKKLEREEDYGRKLAQQVAERTRELALRNEELQLANQKLQDAALTDSMTGLRNRRYLMTHVQEDLAMVERQYNRMNNPDGNKEPTPDFLFLMIDLDGFKQVNDVYGHAAGDLVLLQTRNLLQDACRKSDTIIRWGGDEFMVVGRGVDRQRATTVAERIRISISEHLFDVGHSQTTRLGCSIGFALYPFLLSAPSVVSGEQTMRIADRALYVAKESGRNAWVGIFGNAKTPRQALLPLIDERLETMVLEGAIEVGSSMPGPARLVLEGTLRGNGAAVQGIR